MQSAHLTTRGLATTITVLLLSGCIVHTPKYPISWSPLTPADGMECVDVTGRFANDGRSEGEGGLHPIKLSSLLLPAGAHMESASALQLTPAGSSVIVLATLSDGSTRGFSIELKGRCTPTELVFVDPQDAGGVNREGVLGFSHRSLAFARAADGSLVVRESEGAVGMLLLVPTAGYVRTWSIFQSYGPPP